MPLHPFLVHFPIAAWTLGGLVLALGLMLRKTNLVGSAWVMLALGAAASLPAVLSGQAEMAALGEVTNPVLSRHRSLGNLLPWLMIAVVLAKAHVTFARRAPAVPAWVWLLIVLIISGLILWTGLLGGELVYQWGVGNPSVAAERLPLMDPTP